MAPGRYPLVNAALFGVWLVTGAGFPWLFFRAGARGVGLHAHYYNSTGQAAGTG
ncbi:MAG: 2TM domain-containing protein [Thaumarchaeota archaeon]|nr:2TM domain-containing protein [Nitrososphaerota archaeon]